MRILNPESDCAKGQPFSIYWPRGARPPSTAREKCGFRITNAGYALVFLVLYVHSSMRTTRTKYTAVMCVLNSVILFSLSYPSVCVLKCAVDLPYLDRCAVVLNLVYNVLPSVTVPPACRIFLWLGGSPRRQNVVDFSR